jgi:xylose isomerase
MDPKIATTVLLTIIKQNGLAPGGLNFDCKIRRESSDLEDLFIAHIGAMDTLAYALKTAAKIHEENILKSMVDQRYFTFQSDFGKKVEAGGATFQDCEKFILENGEPKQTSAKQEKFERVFNNYFI